MSLLLTSVAHKPQSPGFEPQSPYIQRVFGHYLLFVPYLFFFTEEFWCFLNWGIFRSLQHFPAAAGSWGPGARHRSMPGEMVPGQGVDPWHGGAQTKPFFSRRLPLRSWGSHLVFLFQYQICTKVDLNPSVTCSYKETFRSGRGCRAWCKGLCHPNCTVAQHENVMLLLSMNVFLTPCVVSEAPTRWTCNAKNICCVPWIRAAQREEHL